MTLLSILVDNTVTFLIIGGVLISREIWLHVQIARLSRDVSWIKRLIDVNFNKGGDK